MKIWMKALLASTLFAPHFWDEPVFADEATAAVRIEPATSPAHFVDADVLQVIGGGGDNGGQQFFFATAPRKMEKGTFLGVTTSAVPAALREQMSLQKGFGLVVETIEKDSPAEKAGIQKYDILQKLNDQLLVNQPQLQVLVRSMKPSESVTLTLLRKGQSITVTASLIERDVPEFADVTMENLSPALAPQILQWEGKSDPFKLVRGMIVNADRNATVVSSDGEQTLELTQKDGSKHLIVKDKSGKVIFDGPIDTPEQTAALPEGVAEKLKSTESKLHKITVRIKAKDTDDHEGEEEKK